MAGKSFEGLVTSNKMKDTIVVSVTRKHKEPRTGKIISSRKKYMVHCATDNKINAGDFVSFVECRPLSKNKKWRFLSTLKKGDLYTEVREDV